MRNEAVAVDRQMVARTVSELRAALPEADDLLVGLLRVAEATRTVLEVDGAGLTLAHEDGPPRWWPPPTPPWSCWSRSSTTSAKVPTLRPMTRKHRAADLDRP
jgi:hypothetical protein